MARGTQLLELVRMLRSEIGRATNVAVGVDDVAELKTKLRRQQELFYDSFDWPFLRQVFTAKDMQAGERYYDFPAETNVDRIERVVVWFSNLPRPITRGIGFAEYAIYNSEDDVRTDPVTRWDVRWTGTVEQMEVWPIPSSNDQTVQCSGIRALRPLINDAHVCDLDDQMIVLAVAAELLGKQGDKSAPLVLKAAEARANRMKGRSSAGGADRVRLGMGEPAENKVQVVVRAR